jgi:hypothetical protein
LPFRVYGTNPQPQRIPPACGKHTAGTSTPGLRKSPVSGKCSFSEPKPTLTRPPTSATSLNVPTLSGRGSGVAPLACLCQ